MVLRIGKLTESESRLVVARDSGEGVMESHWLTGGEFLFDKMQTDAILEMEPSQRWGLYHQVNVLNAVEPQGEKWLRW